MKPQLILKTAEIGSQVEFELTTGSKVSGLLKEIGLEHVTLDAAKGEMIVLVESIIGVQNLNDIDPTETVSNASELDNQIETPDSAIRQPDKIDRPDSAIPSSNKVIVSESSDANIETTDPVPEQVIISEVEDTNNIESIDSVTEQTAISDAVDPNTELGTSVNLEKQALEKLVEIEKQFSTQIQSATKTIGLGQPDLSFSATAKELPGWQNMTTSVYSKWNQIKAYEDAQKTDKLGSKPDDIISSIIADLKSLVSQFPNSPALKRILAYFYSCSGNWSEALRNYQTVAVQSEIVDDWCDVAVCGLELNRETLACYSLWKYFQAVSIIDEEDELTIWYVYVGLVEKFKNFPAFCSLCKQDDIKDDEIESLLDTAIYLLKKTGAEASATEIIQKRLTGESAKGLLAEACQKLDGQPVKSYREFFTEFNNMIALEKKTSPRISKSSKPISSMKRSISQPTQQKQKQQTYSSSGRKNKSQTRVESTSENLYRKAKQADQKGNLEEAESLYQDCLSQNIRSESAVKDLASVLRRLERKDEAVGLLEEYLDTHLSNLEKKETFDNALIDAYQSAGYYKKAIQLLDNTLNRTQNTREQTEIRRKIASASLKLEDYVIAEKQFRSILELYPENVNTQLNLARCLSKRGIYNDPEEILFEIQKISSNVNVAEVLETIENAQSSDFDLTELTEFDKFILERFTFAGLPDGRVTDEGKYKGSQTDAFHDIRKLEKDAKDQQTIRPHERSRCYLSAAKIYFELEDYNEKLYRYLCRSYASLGYVAVSQDKHLDAIREWFYETLRVYSVLQDQNYDEQDAVNALSRFLFSYLGRDKIPTSSPERDENAPVLDQQINYIDQTIEKIISEHPNTDQVFDAIGYLLNNRYAEKRILPCLYSKSDLRDAALKYLENKGIDISDSRRNEEDFVQMWRRLRDTNSEETLTISADFEFLKNNFEFVTDQLEDCLKRLEEIHPKLFFELDQDRVENLQEIFKKALQICNEVGFDEQDYLCEHLFSTDCQKLLDAIAENPTKLSVEVLYRIVQVIQKRVKSRHEDLLESSKPDLKLRLAKVSYPRDREIEVHIAVENAKGRMPASSLTLEIEDDVSLFTIDEIDNPNESLRGGESTILRAILSLTDRAKKAFSLSAKVLYTIRGNKDEKTDTENFPIRLDSKDEFEDFENPYAPLLNNQEVQDKNMFKGREKEINKIANVIQQSGSQSKCVLVYGQYRSGKSSLRYHLTEKLKSDEKLFVVDLGNEFPDLGVHNSPITVRIFAVILDKIKTAVNEDSRFNSLSINIPTRDELIENSFPLQLFDDILIELKNVMRREFGIEQIVLLIDEFQYIYNVMLITGSLNADFMRTWKARLQKNLFSAVLVGQQVMAHFGKRFPNEFASIERVPVSYLTDSEARQLIEDPIRIGGESGETRFKEQAVERILKLTGRSAYYIVKICAELVYRMNDDRTDWVTEADVQKVVDELIEEFEVSNFNNFTSAGDESSEAIPEEDALEVLTFIANKSIKSKCRHSDIHCDTSLTVDKVLSDLVSRDVVELDGDVYKIKVGLFEKWLINQGERNDNR